MLRKRKKYMRPKRLHDIARTEEENAILRRYGLKSKNEIWKADAKISKIRDRAKELITKSTEEQRAFINKLSKRGFHVNKIEDILALNKENILDRRLQTIVVKKKIARTPKSARQLITHKHILIKKNAVNIPSYHVDLDEEDKIELRTKNKKNEEGVKENG